MVGGRVRNGAASGTQEWFLLARYLTTGALDTSFGSGGIRTYNAGSATYPEVNHESISGLAIDASGRIVAAGTFSAQNVKSRFALLRFRPDGSNDTTFGPGSTGMVTFVGCTQQGCAEEAFATSVALQSDGKIVVAGSARLAGSGLADYDVALARFLPSGWPDPGFGENGFVRTQLGNIDEAWALEVAGGSLFVAGHSGGQAIVARYSLSNGSLLSGFDGGVAMPATPCPGVMAPVYALAIQSFPCRGTGPFCVPLPKPVIVGTCISF